MHRSTGLRTTVALATLLLGGASMPLAQRDSPPPAAAPGSALAVPPTTATTATTDSPTARPPDVKTVVDRIQRRIASELIPQAARPAGGAPAGRLQSRAGQDNVAPAGKNRGRIHLEWRLSLVWPTILTD